MGLFMRSFSIPLLVMKGFVKFSLLLPFLLVRLDVFGQQCSTARFDGKNYEVSRNKVNNKDHCLNELRFKRDGKTMCLAKTPTKETKRICCCGSDDCPCSSGPTKSGTCPSKTIFDDCSTRCNPDDDNMVFSGQSAFGSWFTDWKVPVGAENDTFKAVCPTLPFSLKT